MKVPDREIGREIIGLTDGLLSIGEHALPVGLKAALREYKSALLAESAHERWAKPGCSTRYGIMADLIEQEITEGRWKLGERLPSADFFAEKYGEKLGTVTRALYVLTVRGRLAYEDRSYYVLPRDML